MTPTEYLKIEKVQREIIEASELRIYEAREQAEKCPPPEKRRPAKASDIVEGAIIWHERSQEEGGDYWHIVDEPMYYGDAFKAYCADDGCRYGLQGAYVELQDHKMNKNNCITHHHSCDCREELIKTVCEGLLHAHTALVPYKEIYRGYMPTRRNECECDGCESARKLLGKKSAIEE